MPFVVRAIEVVIANVLPEAMVEDSDLNGPSSNQVVEADWCPRVILQEDHEEPETNEDHDMNILEQRILVVKMLSSVLLDPGVMGNVETSWNVRLLISVFRFDFCEQSVEENANHFTKEESDFCSA